MENYLSFVLSLAVRPLLDTIEELHLGDVLLPFLLEFGLDLAQVLQLGLHQHDLAAGRVQLVADDVVFVDWWVGLDEGKGVVCSFACG
jgi:hypothetical protein